MAFSATQLSSSSRTAYAADKPIFLGENVLDGVSSANQGWRSWGLTYTGDLTYGSYAVGAPVYDATDSNYPVTRLSDRKTNLRSRALLPSGLGSSTSRWSFAFLASSFSFDTVAILSHNLGSMSKTFGTYSGHAAPFVVSVGISNDGLTWTTVATFTDPLTNKPLVSCNLANGSSSPTTFAQFSGVTYAAISIVCSGAAMGTSSDGLPEIGEIVFGRRTQLLHSPVIPYEDRNVNADVVREAAVTGARGKFTRSAGRRVVRAKYHITTDKADFLNFYGSHIDHGLKQFLYIPKASRSEFPSTYAGAEPGESFWMGLQEDQLNLPVQDIHFLNSLELAMQESAPYNSGIS